MKTFQIFQGIALHYDHVGERFWLLRANRTLADSSPRGREVRFDHFGISDGRIQANNMDVVFHPKA